MFRFYFGGAFLDQKSDYQIANFAIFPFFNKSVHFSLKKIMGLNFSGRGLITCISMDLSKKSSDSQIGSVGLVPARLNDRTKLSTDFSLKLHRLQHLTARLIHNGRQVKP